MNFIEEQYAAVGFFHQTGLGIIRPGKRPLDMPKYMRDEELGIVIIIRTVKGNKRRIFGESVHRLAIGKHHMGKERLADTGLPDYQGMQPIWRIQNRRLALLHLTFQTLICTNQAGKGISLFLRIADKQTLTLLHVAELQRSLPQFCLQQLGQRFPVKIPHRPPGKFYNLVLPMQFV